MSDLRLPKFSLEDSGGESGHTGVESPSSDPSLSSPMSKQSATSPSNERSGAHAFDDVAGGMERVPRSTSLPPLGSPTARAPPIPVLRSRSHDPQLEEPAEANPLSLSRASSRQAHAPAWLATDMSSLGLGGASAVSRATTPRPPMTSSLSADDSGPSASYELGGGDASALMDEESRMLRHLEQHTHLQEEMQAGESTNPNRAEQIQRENNRLLHIAMRRDRNARKEQAKAKGESVTEEMPRNPHGMSPIQSPLRRPSSVDLGSRRDSLESLQFGRKREGSSPMSPLSPLVPRRTLSSSRRRMDNVEELMNDDTPSVRRLLNIDEAMNDTSSRRRMENVEGMLKDTSGGEGLERSTDDSLSPDSARLNGSLNKPVVFENDVRLPDAADSTTFGADHAKRSQNNNGSVRDGSVREGSVREGSFRSGDQPSKRKGGIAGFGASFMKGENTSTTSSRRHRGFGYLGNTIGLGSRRSVVTNKTEGNLPPSFTGPRQRQKLMELVHRIDLEDATLMDAIKKVRPLHPQGFFRRNWDKVLVVAVMYTLIVVPIEVAYSTDESPYRIIGSILDVLFIIDIPLTFRTSYREVNDEYVRDFNQIARNYVRSWLILDLIAAIPVNLIFIVVSAYTSQAFRSYFSLFKLIKIFRIVRLRHLFYALAGLKSSVYIYLFSIVGSFFLLAHWFACMYWKIAALEQENDEMNWVLGQSTFGDLFNESVAYQYSTSIYWAISTVTTLGYGDVRPKSYPEQIYVSIVIILGAAMYAVVIGIIAYIMRAQYDSELDKENFVESVRTFGRQYNLPPNLQQRIHSYFDFLWQTKKRFHAKSLVSDLPLELRADVADAIHKKLIEHNPVLRMCTTLGFKKVFAARLSPSTVRIPSDVLYFEGDEVSEIFFIKKGVVDIVYGLDRGGDSEFVVARRSNRQYLGDMGLFVETFMATYPPTAESINAPTVEVEYTRSSASETDDYSAEDEESEDDTETSGAPHFGYNDGGKRRKPKPKAPAKRSLHHTSAVVVQFSEISSILVADFLQLLDQFPMERALFRAVAMARFKQVREIVAKRFGLQQSPTDEARTADANGPTTRQNSRRFFRFSSSSKNLDKPNAGAATPLQASGSPASNAVSPRLPSVITRPIQNLLGRPRSDGASDRVMMVTPELDDELVRDAVQTFFARRLQKGKSDSSGKFKGARRRDGKLKHATSILMSSVSNVNKKLGKRRLSNPMISVAKDEFVLPEKPSASLPVPETLNPEQFDIGRPSKSTQSSPANPPVQLSSERNRRFRSQSEQVSELAQRTPQNSPSKNLDALQTTPSGILRPSRRAPLLGSPEIPLPQDVDPPQKRRPPPLHTTPMFGSQSLGRTAVLGSPFLSSASPSASPSAQPPMQSSQLETRLAFLIEKVRSLDSQLGARRDRRRSEADDITGSEGD